MTTLKTILATLVVPGTACFLVPYYILQGTHVALTPAFGILQLLALLFATLGVGMIVWVSTAFVRQGKGTPIPIDPPTRLVVQGLYRFVRNPMYLGALLVWLSEVVYFHSVWILVYSAILWAALHTFIVVFEEPQLKRRFGVDYEQYLKAVPRWIPRIPS